MVSVLNVATNPAEAAEVAALLRDAGVESEVLLSGLVDREFADSVVASAASIVLTASVDVAAICRERTSVFVIIAPPRDHVFSAHEVDGAATIESGSLTEAAGFAPRVLGLRPDP